MSFGKMKKKKKCEGTYRVAQLSTLAVFPPWGNSKGADRTALTLQNYKENYYIQITEWIVWK